MLHTLADSQNHAARKLSVALAAGKEQIQEAQRLRYRVFVDEMGARLQQLWPLPYKLRCLLHLKLWISG